MNKCKDCYNMDCIFISETNGCEAVEYCDDFQPMRNSDKIRAMTDEELAEWLFHHSMVCVPGKRPNPEDCVGGCEHCWLDWLQKEVNNGKEEKEENQPAK